MKRMLSALSLSVWMLLVSVMFALSQSISASLTMPVDGKAASLYIAPTRSPVVGNPQVSLLSGTARLIGYTNNAVIVSNTEAALSGTGLFQSKPTEPYAFYSYVTAFRANKVRITVLSTSALVWDSGEVDKQSGSINILSPPVN